MEIYLFIVIILIVFAISDLMVGVSNDAVNFLNSAIGSKVAPRHIIMIVASIGILIGTTFSSGLMEVARKGIFNPDQFILPEIMIIFLAVMITDVLLLDLFNTFGLPTSTTVSIVFELLGAAVAISVIKINNTTENLGDLIKYINTSKALVIISGILLSVVISFTCGAVVQFLTRLVFTFNFQKRLKRYGGIWAGIALTIMTFFILLKGAKGSSFMSNETSEWIVDNLYLLAVLFFLFWGILFQILLLFTKINIFKPIVLIGTFALALAFAANDLVNFIGVPLAGLSSYILGTQSANPSELLMGALNNPVQTNTILLLIAGVIMVLTLWKSKKAQTVTKTELDLARQTEGFERFESSTLSRTIVRMSISLFNGFQKITPGVIKKFVNSRFDHSAYTQLNDNNKEENSQSWDLLRASVNLTVSSILISIGTSLKLPLSTTYVTFMVAMGSSLADRSWGRESAVYRVNGVFTVIGGWFFTAFMAFTVAGVFALIIHFGGIAAIIALVLLAGYTIFRTQVLHKSREKEKELISKKALTVTSAPTAIDAWMKEIEQYLLLVAQNFSFTLDSLFNEDRVNLKQSKKDSKKMKKMTTLLVSDIFHAVKLLDMDDLKGERRYGKIIASIQEIHANLRSVSQRCFDHVDNNHNKPSEGEIDDLKSLNKILTDRVVLAKNIFATRDFTNIEEFKKSIDDFNETVKLLDENQLARIKEDTGGSRNSLLFLGILSDTENISNHITNLVNFCKKSFGTTQEGDKAK